MWVLCMWFLFPHVLQLSTDWIYTTNHALHQQIHDDEASARIGLTSLDLVVIVGSACHGVTLNLLALDDDHGYRIFMNHDPIVAM